MSKINYFKILIVDDEEAMRVSIAAWLTKEGYDVVTAASGQDALKCLASDNYAVVLADIKMPGMDGLTLLKKIKEDYPPLLVVMITAYGSIQTAVESMKQGASDYLMKPFDPEYLLLLMEKLMEQKSLIDENDYLRERLSKHDELWMKNLIGQSPGMKKVFSEIETVALTDTPVLITGETGTGKELVARAIHSGSLRKFSPFIPINCGAVNKELLESELFGHERGAFTGAVQARRGQLELAHCGTLFLDEVGDVSGAMQTSLLRVLEEGEFFRLGGSSRVESDFRLICATNKDLKKKMAVNEFRSDFYYRINVINIQLPPLRDRKEDIALLAFHFLQLYAAELGKQIEGFTRDALNILNGYPWPGNVRELKNVMERAVVLSRDKMLTVADLTFLSQPDAVMDTSQSLKQMEKAYILKVLEENQGNVSKAAQILDINRSTLSRKLKTWQ